MKLRMNVQTVPFLSISEISSYCCPTNISKLGTFYRGYDVSWRCVLFIQEVRADYNINIVSHIYIRRSERLRTANRYLVYSVSSIALSPLQRRFRRCYRNLSLRHHLLRRRLRRHHRRSRCRIRVASSILRVEALGPGSRVKFVNGIYILAHFRQPARSMTHLRDTKRRHLP